MNNVVIVFGGQQRNSAIHIQVWAHGCPQTEETLVIKAETSPLKTF